MALFICREKVIVILTSQNCREIYVRFYAEKQSPWHVVESQPLLVSSGPSLLALIAVASKEDHRCGGSNNLYLMQ